MPGEPDPQYVSARRVLLDAADALAAHLDSVVLVGAQAVYLHTGEAELFDAAAPYTTDADLAIGPADLADSPLLDELLIRRGFTLRESPGRWVSPDGIYIDLMVPEALAVRAAGPNAAPDTIAASLTALVSDLLSAL